MTSEFGRFLEGVGCRWLNWLVLLKGKKATAKAKAKAMILSLRLRLRSGVTPQRARTLAGDPVFGRAVAASRCALDAR